MQFAPPPGERERRRPPPRGDGLRKKFALSVDDVLSTKPQALDQRAVARDVDVLEVAEETATLSDEQEEATTRVVVVLVLLQVLGEVLDPLGEGRNLHLGGSGVSRGGRVLVDD